LEPQDSQSFRPRRPRASARFKLSEATDGNCRFRVELPAMDIVTAITGASGALYAQRFIQGLVAAGVTTHLVVSPLGRRLLHEELGMEGIDLETLAGTRDHTVTLYNYNDVGARLASG